MIKNWETQMEAFNEGLARGYFHLGADKLAHAVAALSSAANWIERADALGALERGDRKGIGEMVEIAEEALGSLKASGAIMPVKEDCI